MDKKTKKIIALVALAVVIIGVVIALVNCGNSKKKYEGTYIGQQGTTLVFNSDGTCLYKEDEWDKAETATWNVEDNTLTISGIERYGYDIYATTQKSSTSLLFEADSSHWNDELFVKSN